MSESRTDGNATLPAPGLLAGALQDWHSRLAAGALCVFLLWFSFPALRAMHPLWVNNYNYSHGYLVLALTAVLFCLEMRRAPLPPFTPSWLGLLCLLALVLATLGGQLSTTVLVPQLALPALWITAIWAFAGAKTARRFAPSLSYLYVAIPVWLFFNEFLRGVTVSVVSAWIRIAGLPAFIEGNFIHVPSGTFEVQDGCAGLRYALVALALAAFTGLLNHRNWRSAALLAFVGLALAVVGNWVRVFITVAVGQSADLQHFLVVRDHHTFFGWALFVVFMAPLFYVDRKLQSRSAMLPTVTVGPPNEARVAAFNPAAYSVLVVLALGVWLTYRFDHADEAGPNTAVLPAAEVPGWSRTGEWSAAPDRPYFAGSTAEFTGWYAEGLSRVGAYVAHYAAQEDERKIVSSQNRPEGQQVVMSVTRLPPMTVSGMQVPLRELEVVGAEGQRRLVWVASRVAGQWAASSLGAKAWQVAGAIRGRRDAQALVFTAECASDCSQARSWLSQFVTRAIGPLDKQADRWSSPTEGSN